MNLDELKKWPPYLEKAILREHVSSYEAFVKQLYVDIDHIIVLLEDDRKDISDLQKNGEDKITNMIKRDLLVIGYDATHDEVYGGHVDLLVKKNNYRWIGEAKIHRGPKYLQQGMEQLITRYTTGNGNQSCGGLLIYIFNKNAKKVMDQWKERVVNSGCCSIESCSVKTLAFLSTRNHRSSGLPFTVRHIPVLLHFDPDDKSVRNRVTQA